MENMENQNIQSMPQNTPSGKKPVALIIILLAICVLVAWFFAKKQVVTKNPGQSQTQGDAEVENQDEQPLFKQ